jgi:hypothetical protein
MKRSECVEATEGDAIASVTRVLDAVETQNVAKRYAFPCHPCCSPRSALTFSPALAVGVSKCDGVALDTLRVKLPQGEGAPITLKLRERLTFIIICKRRDGGADLV